MIKLLTSVFFILFFNLAGAQNVVYVDGVNGSNSNPGTFELPYRTISHAGSNGNVSPGGTIYIRGGTYRERAWIGVAGTPGNPTVVTAYNNEEVIISGADLITTPWTLTNHPSGNVWKTPMPSTRNIPGDSRHEAGRDQIFLNGAMQVEARWPNIPAGTNPATLDLSSYATAATATLQQETYPDNALATAQYTTAPGTQLPANLAGAYVNFVPGARWALATGKITSNSPNSLTFQYRYRNQGGDEAFYKPRNGDVFYLWGKYELLDAPGEWFRKPDEGMLYFYAPNGVNPNNQVVEVKSAGENRFYAFWIFDRSHITIKNIKIRAAYISATSNCSNIIIDGVDIKHGSHYSIVPGWYVPNGGTSISLGGSDCRVTNCNIAYTVEGGISISGNNSKAINNVVHDTGYIGQAGSSISCTSGTQMEARNNTAWGVGSANVIDYRFAKNTKIWYNDASQSGKITFDGGMLMGAVYRNPIMPVYAEGTEVAYNYIHGGQGLSGGDFYGTSGIYFEGHLHDYVIHHNVIWDSGAGINMPDSDYSNFKIYNNTLYNKPIVLYAKPNIVNVEVKNNLFTGFIQDYNKTSAVQKNLITSANHTSVYPDNLYVSNPQLTNPAILNFMPLASSPLVNAGMQLPPYTNGFIGTAPDIGAFESGKPAFVAGALVRPQDVANITVNYDNAAFPNKKFTIFGLPAGRKIGSDFKLRIGTASSGGIMQYDYVTNQVSFTNVPKGNLTGVQPIYLDMGTDGVHLTNSTIDLGTLSVNNIGVYPNPSKGEFFIRIPQEYQDKEVKIRVYALDGKLILDKNLDNNRTDAIKLTAKGIYILKTTIEDQTFTNKIFVQ